MTLDQTVHDGTGEQTLLEVRDLHVQFNTPLGWLHAVGGVSLSLDRGRVLGVVGESGSGKSVFSRTIMGTTRPNRDTKVSGSVRFRGLEMTELPINERRRIWGKEMSMIFQDPMTSLNPVVKVGRQITEVVRRHLHVSKAQARNLAAELLADVGIPEPRRRLGEYPYQLSGGMRQRISIAIALSCGPSLLFADEPTTALDVTVQAQILDLLAEQRAERDMSMVLVTHDLGVVAGHTDEIAVMYAGRVVERAPTKRLFSAMHMPYTEALFNSIPKLDNPPHTPLRVIDGRPPNLARLPQGCSFAPRCLYAQERCHQEAPPLMPAETADHFYACWYPVGFTPRPERVAPPGATDPETVPTGSND